MITLCWCFHFHLWVILQMLFIATLLLMRNNCMCLFFPKSSINGVCWELMCLRMFMEGKPISWLSLYNPVYPDILDPASPAVCPRVQRNNKGIGRQVHWEKYWYTDLYFSTFFLDFIHDFYCWQKCIFQGMVHIFIML